MRNVWKWSAVGIVLFGGLALAQQPQPRQPNVRPGVQPRPTQPNQPGTVQPGAVQPGTAQPGANRQIQQSDQQIAALIANCNRNEVEICRFALNKIQSSEVKETATTLMKDHTAVAEKFSQWAGQVGVYHSTTPGATGRDDSGRNTGGEEGRREEGRREEGRRDDNRRDNEQTQANPAAAPQNPGNVAGARPANPANPAGNPANPNATVTALKPAAGGQLNWVAIHQEFAAEGLATCKKELGRYEGAEFDKAFLGHQIAGHLMEAANLRVLKRHASSQLAGEIDELLQTTEEHLKELRAQMEEKKDQ